MSLHAEALATVHLYDHCAMTSRLVSESVAEGDMPIAPDICTPAGVRASIVGLLMELVTGQFGLQLGLLVLSDMTFHLRDPALDVRRVHVQVEIVRRGRQRVIGIGRLTDADDRTRLIGFGTVSIAVIAEMTDELRAESARIRKGITTRAPDFGDRDVPDVLTVMAVTIREHDHAALLSQVHAGVTGPQGRLHGGAQQLLAEAAALAAAADALGTDRVVTGELSIRFVYPALNGPFEAIPTIVHTGDDDVLVQVDLMDHGNSIDGAGRLTSLTTCRVRRA